MDGVKLPENWRTPDLDLGDEHWLWWNEPPSEPRKPGDNYDGAWVAHRKKDAQDDWSHPCLGHITLSGGGWQLHCFPATISPSLACSCGDHGFIQQGHWVRA